MSAAYASRAASPPPMQGSLPAGGLRLCREGVEPSGSQRKVSGYIHPPFQDFPDASWVHAERLVHKLDTFTDPQRAAQQRVRGLIWQFYADLKAYRASPTPRRRDQLRARFDRIFRRRTGFVTLDRLLQRLHANKAELLMVLDHPEIPLHTNGSENDIRCQVTKRQVSGGTHSDIGRDCRDAFLGLAKTCQKLGIAFWDYLGARLGVPGSPPSRHCQTSSAAAASPPDAAAPGVLPRLHGRGITL